MNGTKFRGILGLGEKASHNFFYQSGTYSLWTKDIPTPIEDGQLPGKNMYGVHPFYIFQNSNNTWVGVFQKLAAAQDWHLTGNKITGVMNVDLYAVGGAYDLTIMIGSTPDETVSQYHSIIGKPVAIPQWALGWHQCRYGYNNTQQLAEVAQGYQDNQIPLDVQWSDIDYMKAYKDFTYDDADNRYKDLPEYV